MKKSERTNHELTFLSNKHTFNLEDLCKEFNISKRTAFRDIQELERLGLPIYVKSGRNGGYTILRKTNIVPLYFTEAEIYSMIFTFQLLKLITTTPFDVSYERIYQKFITSLSDKRKSELKNFNKLVQYKESSLISQPLNLKQLYEYIYNDTIIHFSYSRYEQQVKVVQPVKLVTQYGHWYCEGYDINKYVIRIYRCDYMDDIEAYHDQSMRQSKEDIEKIKEQIENNESTYTFKAKVDEIGEDIAHKTQTLEIYIENNDTETYIYGDFKDTQIDFVARVLLTFGNHIEIIEPKNLVEMYKKYLMEMIWKIP